MNEQYKIVQSKIENQLIIRLYFDVCKTVVQDRNCFGF